MRVEGGGGVRVKGRVGLVKDCCACARLSSWMPSPSMATLHWARVSKPLPAASKAWNASLMRMCADESSPASCSTVADVTATGLAVDGGRESKNGNNAGVRSWSRKASAARGLTVRTLGGCLCWTSLLSGSVAVRCSAGTPIQRLWGSWVFTHLSRDVLRCRDAVYHSL